MNVLFNRDGTFFTEIIGGKQFCSFIFDEDPLPKDLFGKIMKFSDFYKLVVDNKSKFIKYYYETEGFGHHIHAYHAFTKESLDDSLKIMRDEDRRRYDFLFNK